MHKRARREAEAEAEAEDEDDEEEGGLAPSNTTPGAGVANATGANSMQHGYRQDCPKLGNFPDQSLG